MNPALWATLGGAVALLLVLPVLALARRSSRRPGRRRGTEGDAPFAEVEMLRAEVARLGDELGRIKSPTPVRASSGEFVITTAGDPEQPQDGADRPVPDRAVLSVTLGEPLVKLAALGYGVRRALSPESRNRITFAMRREVKRARKARRRADRRARATRSAEEAA